MKSINYIIKTIIKFEQFNVQIPFLKKTFTI